MAVCAAVMLGIGEIGGGEGTIIMVAGEAVWRQKGALKLPSLGADNQGHEGADQSALANP